MCLSLITRPQISHSEVDEMMSELPIGPGALGPGEVHASGVGDNERSAIESYPIESGQQTRERGTKDRVHCVRR